MDAALITALTSIIIAVISAVVSIGLAAVSRAEAKASRVEAQRNAEALARLQNSLADESKARDARRDYEYEARKRLYSELEPIIFQLVSNSFEALYRVRSLARTARNGNLSGPQTWLGGPGYYALSTMYKLYAPAGVVRLMTEHLTMVDLGLDAVLRAQYRLARALIISYTDAFDVASIEPALEYDPIWTFAPPRLSHPEVHWPQGLYVGAVEAAADSLIVRTTDRPPRVMTWGEFENEFRQQGSAVATAFEPVMDTMARFHPASRPVMWRLLIAQMHLFRAFSEYGEITDRNDPRLLKPIRLLTGDDRLDFDWRSEPEKATVDDRAALDEPFAAAHEYLRQRVKDLIA